MEIEECERCGKEDVALIMSMFNTQMLCSECKEKEEKHSEFGKARKAEEEAIRSGNYNFRGIGKPKDL